MTTKVMVFAALSLFFFIIYCESEDVKGTCLDVQP